ncbi:exostosin-2-like isoform X2 [Ornithodoros turicata]
MKPHYNLRKIVGPRIAVGVAIGGAFILAALLLYPWRIARYETAFVVRLLDQSPRVVVHSSSPVAEPRDETCTHFTCFDVYKCGHTGPRVTVYVYPIFRYVDEHGNVLAQQPSREFMELLDDIQQSEFYISDPTKACLFIPSLDLLNEGTINPKGISQILNSLPYWNNGTNHILFNMLPGTAPDYVEMLGVNTGRAMVMGGGFSTWTYRRGYDISIPVFNPARYSMKRPLPKRKRPWLVAAFQPHIHFEFRSEIATLANEHAGVIQLGLCNHAWDPNNATVRCLGEKVFKYPNVLKEASFCFVVRAARLGQSALSDALMANCIPVIVADSYVLPFSEVLDWKRAALQIREDDVHDTVKILKGVSQLRIAEMRDQCMLLWERYFSSMARIGRTVLNILNDRIFPHVSKTYEDWNDHPPGLIPPSPFLFPTISPHGQGFTAVVLTYDRVNSLFKVIQQLAQVPSLVKIVVVWNNQKKRPPTASAWPKLNKPLKVIQTQANKLSNRFYPYKDIETEAVLAIDDDILMLTSDELEFGFEVWREFPDRIVGFPSRVHLWDNSTDQWKYESEWTNDVSMVLTGAAFYHKHYSYEYFEQLPLAVRRWVDNHMNCEDIAMNFLVANISGKAPIKVAPRKKFKCPECARLDNLSNDLQHLAARSECVNIFTEAFGTMPLQTVEFRADPVLFKDNFPEKLKRFPNLGSL